jgi:hypothetical protein
MRPAFTIFGHWGTSPSIAVNLEWTTVYVQYWSGYPSTLLAKGLGRIGLLEASAACHFLYVNTSLQKAATIMPTGQS